MRNNTVSSIKNLLPTQLLAVNLSENPDVKRHVVLSPDLQQRVNALLSSHSSLQSFMQVMNPELQCECARHVERAHFGTAPTLITLRCAYCDEAATMWMVPQLYDLGEYCGVKEKLDEHQLTQLARIIIQEFGFLKVTEVMLFLHRLKAGHYGRFYGAIDPMAIVMALRQDFMRERAAAIDEHERAQQRARWQEHCQLVARQRAEARAAGRPMYPRPATPPAAKPQGRPVSPEPGLSRVSTD